MPASDAVARGKIFSFGCIPPHHGDEPAAGSFLKSGPALDFADVAASHDAPADVRPGRSWL